MFGGSFALSYAPEYIPKFHRKALSEDNKYHFIDLLKEIPKTQETSKHLDLGAGENSPCTQYLEEVAEAEIESIVDSTKVDIRNFKEEENFLQADARNLPMEEETFDIVTMGKLLHYFEDEEMREVVDETKRVLRPGGYVAGDIPINRLYLWPFYKISESEKIENYREMLTNRFDLKDYGAGWNIGQERTYNKSVYFLGEKPSNKE